MIRPAIIGWREWVGLPELQGSPLLAKIDTGAWSNTLHASEIEIIEGQPETRICLLYTSDAADEMACVDLGGRGII